MGDNKSYDTPRSQGQHRRAVRAKDKPSSQQRHKARRLTEESCPCQMTDKELIDDYKDRLLRWLAAQRDHTSTTNTPEPSNAHIANRWHAEAVRAETIKEFKRIS